MFIYQSIFFCFKPAEVSKSFFNSSTGMHLCWSHVTHNMFCFLLRPTKNKHKNVKQIVGAQNELIFARCCSASGELQKLMFISTQTAPAAKFGRVCVWNNFQRNQKALLKWIDNTTFAMAFGSNFWRSFQPKLWSFTHLYVDKYFFFNNQLTKTYNTVQNKPQKPGTENKTDTNNA